MINHLLWWLSEEVLPDGTIKRTGYLANATQSVTGTVIAATDDPQVVIAWVRRAVRPEGAEPSVLKGKT